jgi:hypothetical protein
MVQRIVIDIHGDITRFLSSKSWGGIDDRAANSSCTYLQLTSRVDGMFLFSFSSDTNDYFDNAVYISSELAYWS